MSPDERQRVMETTLEHVAGRVPVLVGGSDNSTAGAIRYSRAAQAAGADGIMVVHPYYCLPTERELEAHYRDLAQAVDLPIMIYNNPWTTGVDMKPAQLARVAEAEPNIRYVKESSGDAARVGQILSATDRLIVFSGWDNLALEHFVAGARAAATP
jgi:4-hydroxy-tetrahydrodipicolinate synthase